MCRDQNLISETNERTDKRTDKCMKIEKPGVGRPLLGPANSIPYRSFSKQVDFVRRYYPSVFNTRINFMAEFLTILQFWRKGGFCKWADLPQGGSAIKEAPSSFIFFFFFQIYHTVQFKTIPQTTERTGQQADMVSNKLDRVISLAGHLNRWYSNTRQNLHYL